MTIGSSSRSQNRVRGRSASAALLCALILLGAAPLLGQSENTRADATGLELTIQTQRALDQIGELWLQWSAAYLQDDPERAMAIADSLQATAEQLGFSRLPDLAFGALVKAGVAAEAGEHERASLALATAEAFDPGRPETAFGQARVARLEGDWWRSATQTLTGYGRLWNQSSQRKIWGVNLLIWLSYVLLAAGGLFVVVQMFVKGGSLVRDFTALAERAVPSWAALPLAIAGLLWPLLLPNAWLWLFLLWAVLLWGYCSMSERIVLLALFIVMGLVPTGVSWGRGVVARELSPQVRAIESLKERRLYGSLFSDIGALRATLPESKAVRHLVADAHRILGQWEVAGAHYREQLESEPNSPTMLVNLGAYYYYKGDYGSAIRFFRRATELAPNDPAAFYDLSQALLGTVQLFDDSQVALRRARQIDDDRVSQWVKNSDQEPIQTYDGGLDRSDEIRRDLREAEAGEAGPGSQVEGLRRGLSLVILAGVALLAMGLHLVRRSYGYSLPPIDLRPRRNIVERILRAILPGFSWAEVGDGGRSFASLALVTGLLAIPLAQPVLFRVGWGFAPDRSLAWTVAWVGLAVWVATRLILELRRER